MDKLKPNAYWIAVGGTGIVLLAAIYFLVFAPLSELSGKRDEVDALTKKLSAMTSKKNQLIPTAYYKGILEEKEKADKDAHDRGKELYDAQGKKFDLFFDDAEAQPALVDFSAKYKDELDKMISGYREKYKVVADEQNPDQTPPKVSRFEGLDDAKIPQAMKEFWFIQEVFNACNELGLGGLKLIDFPGRAVESKEVLPFNKWMSGTVEIEMPFAKVEDFLSKLYSSERVLFQLDELSYHKTVPGLGKFATLDHSRQFKDVGDTKVEYKDEIPDPDVVVNMRISAFDWTGAPELKDEAPAASPGEKGAGKQPAGKPTGKPPGPKKKAAEADDDK